MIEFGSVQLEIPCLSAPDVLQVVGDPDTGYGWRILDRNYDVRFADCVTVFGTWQAALHAGLAFMLRAQG